MRFIQKEAEVPATGRGRPKKEPKPREMPKPGQYTSEQLGGTKKLPTSQGGV